MLLLFFPYPLSNGFDIGVPKLVFPVGEAIVFSLFFGSLAIRCGGQNVSLDVPQNSAERGVWWVLVFPQFLHQRLNVFWANFATCDGFDDQCS